MFLQKKDGRVVEVAQADRDDYVQRTEGFSHQVRQGTAREDDDPYVSKHPAKLFHIFLRKRGGNYSKLSKKRVAGKAIAESVQTGEGEDITISGVDMRQANNGENINGEGVFSISRQEVTELEESGRLFFHPDMPPLFYRNLLVAINNDKKRIAFDKMHDGAIIKAEGNIQELAENAQKDPKKYGFRDQAHANKIINMSLSNLGRLVGIGQKTYSMVGNNYQIQEKPDKSHVSVSTSGLDFRLSGTIADYFDKENDYAFKEGAAEKLFEDILESIHLELMIMKEMGAKEPSFLATGCGVFLGDLPDAQKDIIREYYAAARFLLLKHGNYDFDRCYFHPGSPKNTEPMLRAFHQFGGNNVAFQTEHDAAVLANEGSKEGLETGINNASDAEVTLTGIGGKVWEHIADAFSVSYVGEEIRYGHSLLGTTSIQVDQALYTKADRQQNVARIGNRAAILAEARAGGMFDIQKKLQVREAREAVENDDEEFYDYVSALNISEPLKDEIFIKWNLNKDNDLFNNYSLDQKHLAALALARGSDVDEAAKFSTWYRQSIHEKVNLQGVDQSIKTKIEKQVRDILSSDYFSTISFDSEAGKAVENKLAFVVSKMVADIAEDASRAESNMKVLRNINVLVDDMAQTSNAYEIDQCNSDFMNASRKQSTAGKIGQAVWNGVKMLAHVITTGWALGMGIALAYETYGSRSRFFSKTSGTEGDVNKSVEELGDEVAAQRKSTPRPGGRGSDS